jgi:hypothetical protein
MGFFGRLFGKKQEAAPAQPPPAPQEARPAAPPPQPAPVRQAPPPAAAVAPKPAAPMPAAPKPAAPRPAAPPPAPPKPAAPQAQAPAAPPASPSSGAAVPWMTAADYEKKKAQDLKAAPAVEATTAVTGKVEVNPESEFYQGFVRFTVSVKNGMNVPAGRTQVILDYNEDILRLQRIEPKNLRAAGSRVLLGDLKPGDSRQLVYYLDPQICTESLVDGVVQYKLPDGKSKAVNMKPMKAEVVCPLFFTKEVASSALLKRLVENELRVRDSKVYHPTLGMGATHGKVYDIAKSAVLAHDVKEVREFLSYNPYGAECWFYGETKVKGYKIVIRAAVREQENVVELFSASTEAKAVTGLLAELNRQLVTDLESKLPGTSVEQVLDDTFKEKVQAQAQTAKLSVDEIGAGETEI